MRRGTEKRLRRAVARRAGCEPGDAISASCAYCGLEIQVMWWAAEPTFTMLGWWEDDGMPFAVGVAHLDHVIPECMNGPTSLDNTVIACAQCNRAKGAKPLGDPAFLRWLAVRREDVRAEGLALA